MRILWIFLQRARDVYYPANQAIQVVITYINISQTNNKQEIQKQIMQPSFPQTTQLQAQPQFQFSLLPDANPIQKRQKLQPYSLFPLYALPKFVYDFEIPQATQSQSQMLKQEIMNEKEKPNPNTTTSQNLNQALSQQKQKLTLQSTSLKQLFRQTIYQYNPKASKKNNAEFGSLKANCSESVVWKMGKNVETIQEYQELRNNVDGMANQQREGRVGNEQQIYFQSRFQSGNLCFAACSKIASEPTYYLICSRDINTSKCTQWFFFKTINKVPGKVNFHILNFIKSYSIFQSGMKICYASKSNDYKWARGCTQIKYRQTTIPISSKNPQKFYYALTFSFTYSNPEDNVYFSYCYPYTYSMLQNFLFPKTQQLLNPFLKRRNIAISLGGNSVDLLTITNFKNKQKKRVVFITARVHPGETPSSFICEGMMRFLLGNTEEATQLRDNFVFKFVPMLNPDGVINGAYRCSLSGYDLNRVWNRVEKNLHPEVFGTKKAIYESNEIQKIFMFADLHAHSKKKGVFAYGCQNKTNPYLCRQIPFLFWKNVPDFNYYQCNFMMKTGREGTARLHIYRQLDIDYSYTIQHSFCGPSKERIHYTAKDYLKIGSNYCKTFYKFFCRNKKVQIYQLEVFQELYTNKELVKIGESQQLSSSDEQLDKEKAPIGLLLQQKPQKKLSRRQSLRMSEGKILNQKKTITNFRKFNAETNDDFKNRQGIIPRFKETQNFSQTVRPLPIVNPTFKLKNESKIDEDLLNFSQRPRVCSSSLTNHLRPDNEEKKSMRQTFRYDEQEDVNGLTNLFLPSLTSASYKKYNRKSSSPKNIVHVGANSLIENAIVLKQEIKSATQKKKLNWKQHARSYL